MKQFLKLILTIFLLFSAIFLVSCSNDQPELPEGTMLYYELENPENTMWKSYTIEEEPVDLFAEWQEEQKNTLAQRDWDAYVKNDN
ncbi:MAG: hypothetical protein KAT77_06290 [Nanoarchaeota archaeon]|nr:hypothetical protein [Nanoarchaeota archaeon]